MKVLLWVFSVFSRISKAVKNRILKRHYASAEFGELLTKEGDTSMIKITCKAEKASSVYEFAREHGYCLNKIHNFDGTFTFLLWK